jgi:hypothetical protein
VNHQVDVQRQIGGAAYGVDDYLTERYVGHEPAIHYIHVDQVGAGIGNVSYLLSQAGEVRG